MENAALPEDTDCRYELQEGSVMMSPRPAPDHQDGIALLRDQLVAQLTRFKVLQEVDVDLELAPPDRPGTVRVPDLVVVPRAAFTRARHERTQLRASEVLLAGGFGYQYAAPVRGEFATDAPFPLRVDVAGLLD